jgi:hypothetical protein
MPTRSLVVRVSPLPASAGMRLVAVAREMIQSALQRPVQEQRQAEPPAFLALQPRLPAASGEGNQLAASLAPAPIMSAPTAN